MMRRTLSAFRNNWRSLFRLFEIALQQQLAPLRASIAKAIGDNGIRRLRLYGRTSRPEFVLTERPTGAAGQVVEHPLTSPVVSVIVPTWNRAGIVGDAVRSVQKQHFSDWELLVIDDGSSDETASVLAAFAGDCRIKYMQRPHAGQCAARNYGLGIAKGSLIAYLDSDNLWYPGFLAAAVAVFANRPEVDCGYGALISGVHGIRVLFEPFDRDRLLAGNYIDISTFIHRRSMVERFGDFDARTTGVEDWDLVLRYTVHAPAYRIPVVAARYRVMDGLRVSDVLSDESPATVRRKWQGGDSESQH